MSEIRRLFAYLVPYWKRLLIGLIGLVGSSVITLTLPYAISQLVDSVFLNRNYAQLNLIGIGLTGLFFIQGLVSFAYRYYLQTVAQRAVADLRLNLHKHLLRLPLSFFTNNRVGELLSRMSNDASVLQGVIVDVPVALIRQIITVIGGIGLMFWTNWQLSLIILAMILPFVLMATRFGNMLKGLSRSVQDRLADATVTLEELLSGIRVVKSFAQEDFEEKRYSTEIERSYDVAIKREFQRSVFIALFTGLGFGSMTFLIWFGGRQVIAGQITPGELVGFLIYFIVVSAPLTDLANVWGRLQEGLGSAQRIFEIMDESPEPGLLTHREQNIEKQVAQAVGSMPNLNGNTSGHAPSQPTLNGNAHASAYEESDPLSSASFQTDRDIEGHSQPIRGHVRFVNVNFRYHSAEPDRELPTVLHEIDIEANSGEVIALVGYSGSGKSTLVNLLPRFYDPNEGQIEIDGIDIRTLPVRALRSQIGLVPQETFLFGGSVRENIGYGNLDAGMDEIQAAAHAAYAHEFIDELPQQYETIVGERGVKLSAGQRQRIAIARAILKNPRILLLDEATSALDTESERWVQAALDRLMEGRTSFVIAHRLSTIQRADLILVMDKGRIVERGSHETLLAKDGIYQRLHQMQFDDGNGSKIVQ
ncbi:MAG: ABC transporter ATP-binding protein [Chloroflexota bacterium]